MNPRCLKETISPGCGFHLFANSVVPAGATNRTPFGLYEHKAGKPNFSLPKEQECEEFTFRIPRC